MTGVVLNAVPSPVELVENVQAAFIPATAPGPRPLLPGCARVFATSWPYIGHSPPATAAVQAAEAAAGDAQQVAKIARPTPRAAPRTRASMPLLRENSDRASRGRS